MLTEKEIIPGAVSFLITKAMFYDPNTIATVPQQIYDNHPFVVFHEQGDRCLITPLTTRFKIQRLEILFAWRMGGRKNKPWMEEALYLNDGSTFYSAFKSVVALASQIDFDNGEDNKMLSYEGLLAIRHKVRKQAHRRVQGHNLF